MNVKLVRDYLAITFAIAGLFWGGCALISQVWGVSVDNALLKIPYMIGGFSPTIASYISLKRHHIVDSFKEWLKTAFDIKHRFRVYALVLVFVVIYYLIGCMINGFEAGAPAFMLIVIIPMMLFGGGNEELGWRMILQPETERQFGFHLATVMVGVIWWVWHLPLFFIQGTANANMDYILFGMMCLTLSYALGTIRKISNGVFPCIVMHCLINGLSAVMLFEFSWISCSITLAVTVICSTVILKTYTRVARKTTSDL